MPARNAVGALDRGAVGDLVGPAVQINRGTSSSGVNEESSPSARAGAAVLLRGARMLRTACWVGIMGVVLPLISRWVGSASAGPGCNTRTTARRTRRAAWLSWPANYR